MKILNRDKIKEISQRAKNGEVVSEDEVLSLFGGEELYNIFEEHAVNSLVEKTIRGERLHHFLDDEQMYDAIEGLLNKKVTGNLGKFLNVNSDYIFTLPPEEKQKLAKTFSEGETELENLLNMLWSKKIKTIACGGEIEKGYVFIELPHEDVENIERFENSANSIDGKFELRVNEKKVTVSVSGPKDKIYSAVIQELSKEYPEKDNRLFKELIRQAANSYQWGLELGRVQGKNEAEANYRKDVREFTMKDMETLIDEKEEQREEALREQKQKYEELLKAKEDAYKQYVSELTEIISKKDAEIKRLRGKDGQTREQDIDDPFVI